MSDLAPHQGSSLKGCANDTALRAAPPGPPFGRNLPATRGWYPWRHGGPESNGVTGVKRLFAGKVNVHYSAMYFQGAADSMHGMKECFEGQMNGLCGARMRDLLFLRTGLHTGCVNVTVDFWDREPPLEDSWEEAVEVSFVVNDAEWTGIVEWGSAG